MCRTLGNNWYQNLCSCTPIKSRPSSPRNITSDGGVLKIADGSVSKAAAHEGSISLLYPMLMRSNYTTWAVKMKVFMRAQGVWNAIVDEEVNEARSNGTRGNLLRGARRHTAAPSEEGNYKGGLEHPEDDASLC